MPLKSGKSQKVMSSNIKEVVDAYKSSGRIGTSKPKSKAAAVKQAVAIAYNKAGATKKAKGGEIMQTSAVKGSQAPRSVVSSQEASIKRRGGKVTFKRDGNLPVGLY
jgi:hypothetical protein